MHAYVGLSSICYKWQYKDIQELLNIYNDNDKEYNWKSNPQCLVVANHADQSFCHQDCVHISAYDHGDISNNGAEVF